MKNWSINLEKFFRWWSIFSISNQTLWQKVIKYIWPASSPLLSLLHYYYHYFHYFIIWLLAWLITWLLYGLMVWWFDGLMIWWIGDLRKMWKENHCEGRRSFGGSDRGIINKTFIGWILDKGGNISAISIAVIPNDQMSALLSYFSARITSGAIQYGVPVNVFLLLNVESNWALTPKSTSFFRY